MNVEIVQPSQAPRLIGLAKKSLDDERVAIETAMLASRGCVAPVPVVYNGKAIGMVFGRGRVHRDPWVGYLPLRERVPVEKLWAGYTSYDQIINANTAGRRGSQPWFKNHSTAPVANNWYDLWPVGGMPQAGTYSGAANTAKSFDDTIAGGLYKFGNQSSTYTMHLLTQWATASAGTPMLLLYDRVLAYEACVLNTTSSVTNTNTATAGRYASSGLSGMQAVFTCQTATGATATILSTLSYTNQAGTSGQLSSSGQSSSLIVSAAAPTSALGARVICPATSGATLPWSWCIPLAVGDSGMRAIASYTLSAVTSGTACIVLARPLAYCPLPTAGTASMIDMVQAIAGLERVYDGAHLSMLAFMPTTGAPALQGSIDFGWN